MIQKIKNRIGERFLSNEGYWFTITEISDCKKYTVKFDEGFVLYNVTYSNLVRGDLPIGVFNHKNRFIVRLRKNGKRVYLGLFDTPEEAFQAYKTAKEEYIKEVADKWREQIAESTYYAMYNYEVEITD